MLSTALLDLLSLAVRWIPIRFTIIDSTENGVRWRFGRDIRLLGPGWYAFVPWIEDISTESILPQVVETNTQTVETTDGTPLSVSLGLHYRVYDVRQWTTGVESFDDSVLNLVELKICEQISSLTYEEFLESDVIADTKAEIMPVAGNWGVEILDLNFITAAKTRPITLLGESLC